MANIVELDYLVNLAMKKAGQAHMRPVIEKELLHYDILFALDQENLLDLLTFQGGTALRLCYGLERFSEDLDFAGGTAFASEQLRDIKTCLEDYLSKRYGLEVSVKEPKEVRKDPDYHEINVDRWQINVTTAPTRKDIPKQKIKLEVTNIPAYTKNPRPLLRNYDFLPDGYQDTLVLTEGLDEIMADKLISFVNTTHHIRHRDIWDLRWLKQQEARVNHELVLKKITDYKIADYASRLNHRIQNLSNIVSSEALSDELSRFIPAHVQERTLKKEKFLQFLKSDIKEFLLEVQKFL